MNRGSGKHSMISRWWGVGNPSSRDQPPPQPVAGALNEMEPIRDPMIASLAICLAFFLLGLINLGQPQVLYFDESWYLPAAAKMLKNLELINREHPPLAKELIALFYWAFGGSWMSARIGSLFFGVIGLYGFQRAHFYATRSFWSTVLFGILVATNCLYFTTSRAALLDPYMLGFAGIALAFFTRGVMFEARQVRNFFLAGISMGLAMACKWTIAPLGVFMAAVTIIRFRRDRRQLAILGASAAGPAIVTYFLTFLPFLFTTIHPLELTDFLPLHRMMVFHLGMYIGDHPYQSSWWEWPLGRGQIWFFDGQLLKIDRVIILAQNPVSALVSAPAVVIGTIMYNLKRDHAIGATVLAYVVTLGFWAIGHKPNVYLYHYNLPSVFALSLVAQVAVTFRHWAQKIAVVFLAALQILTFAYFWPVTTGALLEGRLEKLTSHYGWRENHRSDKRWEPRGEGRAMSEWAMRCINAPARDECSKPRRNSAQPIQ